MRAVHFTDSTVVGGAERALLLTADAMRLHGWEPIILHAPAPQLALFNKEASDRGLTELHIRALPEGARGLLAMLPLVRQLCALRPAVFHAHLTWPMSCKYALMAALVARVPVVIATAHLAIDVRLTLGQRLQHRALAARVDRYIGVSHGVARHLVDDLAIPPGKVTVVPNGIDVDRFAAVGTRNETGANMGIRILIPARLDAQKGHRYALAALPSVSGASLLLAGEGPELLSLEAQARILGIADRVHFLGPRTDIPELLAVCDIVCLPSLYEGLPLALLEAMAAGKPVVASAIPGVDEVVSDGVTGILVPPGDAAALAQALCRLISDPESRECLGMDARNHVRATFTLQTMAARIDAVYRHALAGDGGSRA
jgi:glycosyltransferase involved in cell wall biosynthesis